MKKSQGRPLAIVTPVSAVIVTIVLLLNIHASALRSQLADPATVTAEIAVEHQLPLTLHIDESTGKAPGIVEVRGDGKEPVLLNVPADWKRREVRGAQLESVTADPPNLGYIRWHLPNQVTLSFWVPASRSLLIYNPSGSPLLVLGKMIDTQSGKVEEQSTLVKDGKVRLW